MKSQNEGNMSGDPKNKNYKGRTRRDAFSNEEHLDSFGRLERRLWKFLEQICHGRSQKMRRSPFMLLFKNSRCRTSER